MVIKFLGQGFNPTMDDSVGSHLIRLLSEREFDSFTWFSAFASESGIRGLSSYIERAKANFRATRIIVGVDQKGTSKEALEAILALKADAFVFFQPSNSIFHPKIYLFEGEEKAELIVGSSNLTTQGLFSNVEASLMISFDNREEKDFEAISHLKAYFKGIFELNDPNLRQLSHELIEQLVRANIVPTEMERQDLQSKTQSDEQQKTASFITSLFPKRAASQIPLQFRIAGFAKKRASASKAKKEAKRPEEALPPSPLVKLVWRRTKLPASSAQSSGQGTNPTGGLRLVQSDFVVEGKRIDQTTYFRHDLFGGFEWNTVREKPLVEVATVPFDAVINGKYVGRFDLEVRHKPSGEAGQHNYTTSISWGQLGKVIRDANLTGAQLEIYAPASGENPFTIVIFKK